jgi:hypothetical protein
MSELEEVKEERVKSINDRIKEAVIIRKEDMCKHEWSELANATFKYKALNGYERPLSLEFCRLCKLVRVGGDIL